MPKKKQLLVPKMKLYTNKRIVRIGAILVALIIMGTGLITLVMERDLFYSNWWGGLVFAPLTLLTGIFFLCLIVFKWKKLMKM